MSGCDKYLGSQRRQVIVRDGTAVKLTDARFERSFLLDRGGSLGIEYSFQSNVDLNAALKSYDGISTYLLVDQITNLGQQFLSTVFYSAEKEKSYFKQTSRYKGLIGVPIPEQARSYFSKRDGFIGVEVERWPPLQDYLRLHKDGFLMQKMIQIVQQSGGVKLIPTIIRLRVVDSQILFDPLFLPLTLEQLGFNSR